MKYAAIVVGLSLLTASPALAASEIVNITFLAPDGGVTTNTYHDSVMLTVSGSGNSLFGNPNDAFYIYSGAPHHDGPGGFYQLTFGISTLVAFNPSQNAINFMPGGLPAYSPDHVYSFVLNTGSATPTLLHFGVGDGNFGDNGGAYQIRVEQLGVVPEPATWAMMILGFGGAGIALRRRLPSGRPLER